MTKKDLIDCAMQFILMVAASSVGEELFYRAAVQVCLGASASGFDQSLDKLKIGNNEMSFGFNVPMMNNSIMNKCIQTN